MVNFTDWFFGLKQCVKLDPQLSENCITKLINVENCIKRGFFTFLEYDLGENTKNQSITRFLFWLLKNTPFLSIPSPPKYAKIRHFP